MEELTEQQIRERNSRFIVKVTDSNNQKIQEKWITTKDIDTELNKLRTLTPEYKYEVVFEYKESGL